MTTVQNNVETDLTFNVKTQEAQAGLDNLNKRMQALKERADKAEESFRTLGDVSTAFAASGALIFAPAILSAQRYIDAVGKSEAVSKRYLAAQERQQKAQIEFGRKSAQALAPYNELLASILEKLSRVDPRVLSAGIAIGGALTLVGAAGLIASQIGLFASAVVKLGTYINTLSAVQAAGGLGRVAAVGGVTVGALAAGTGAGIGITRGIGRATGDERLAQYGLDDAFETFKQLLVVAGATFLDALGGAAKTIILIDATLKAIQLKLGIEVLELSEKFEEAGRNLKNAIIELVGETIAGKLGIRNEEVTGTLRRGGTPGLTMQEQAAADAALLVEETNQKLQNIDDSILGLKQGLLDAVGIGDEGTSAGAGGTFSDESLALFDQYQQAEKAALEQYNADKKDINKRFNDESLKLETEYNRQRKQQLEDFNKQQTQAQKDFERTQARAVKDNARQIANLRKQASDADREAQAEYDQNRADSLAAFRQEEIKREADFARRRKRQQEQTNEQLLEAAGRLDAQAVLSILKESTKTARQEGEDFSGETTQRQTELQQRLADDKRAFEQNRQQRQVQLRESIAETQRQFAEQQRLAKEDFEYRQTLERQRFDESRAREAENFARQQQERRAQHVRDLNEATNAYNQQKKARQAQFLDAYNQLNGFQQYEAKARQAHYQRLATDLQAFLNGAAQAAQPARQSGGTRQRAQFAQYAEGTPFVPRTGLALLHAGERVLTAAQNQLLRAGGTLTNQGVQSIANNNQRSINIGDVNVNVAGTGASANDIGRAVRGELTQILANYVGA